MKAVVLVVILAAVAMVASAMFRRAIRRHRRVRRLVRAEATVAAAVSAWMALPPTLETEAEVMRDVIERFDIPPEEAEGVPAHQARADHERPGPGLPGVDLDPAGRAPASPAVASRSGCSWCCSW